MYLAFSIAAGGAIGALARHFLSQRISLALGQIFPYGTLGVNVIGSFLMGLLIILLARKLNATQEVQAFLTVGLLGGFTTFSAFSMETVLLIERQSYGLAAAYILGSVSLAIGGLFLGIALGRVIT